MAKEILDLKKQLTNIYVKHTGKDYDSLRKQWTDNYLSPSEAIELGLIDNVIEPKGKITADD